MQVIFHVITKGKEGMVTAAQLKAQVDMLNKGFSGKTGATLLVCSAQSRDAWPKQNMVVTMRARLTPVLVVVAPLLAKHLATGQA